MTNNQHKANNPKFTDNEIKSSLEAYYIHYLYIRDMLSAFEELNFYLNYIGEAKNAKEDKENPLLYLDICFSSLLDALIVNLSSFYDKKAETNKSCSFIRLMNECIENIKNYHNENDVVTYSKNEINVYKKITDLKAELLNASDPNSLHAALQSIKKIRNKLIAHYDVKYFSNPNSLQKIYHPKLFVIETILDRTCEVFNILFTYYNLQVNLKPKYDHSLEKLLHFKNNFHIKK